MASTWTTAIGAEKPANGDDAGTWDVPVRAVFDLFDAQAAIFMFGVQVTEHPSASLNVRIQGGTYYSSNGSAVVVATNTSMALTTAATNYIFLTDGATTFSQNTTGFPANLNNVPIATVVCGATTITSITDSRRNLAAQGGGLTVPAFLPLAAADTSAVVVVTAGTTNGVQIGSASSAKIGFFGSTPVIQPSGASQAAIGSFTSGTITDNTGGSATTTFAAITAGSSYAQADMVAVKNIAASVAAQLNDLQTDLATIKTLVNALRTALVPASLGLIKGSA
jgi:hypothetical protein